MNKIIFPLKLRMKRPEVADLQDALQLLLDRGVILADDEAARRELSEALKRERVEPTYANATRKLVGLFQEARQLQPSGAVDEPTADTLSALLEEWGLLGGSNEESSWIVRGRIVSHELRGLTGLRVVAVDKNVGQEVRLGEGASGERGAYEIRYSLARLKKDKPDVQVQATGQNGEVLAVSAVRYNAGPVESGLDIVIPVEKLPRLAEYRRQIVVREGSRD